jgi:hypothetical protein
MASVSVAGPISLQMIKSIRTDTIALELILELEIPHRTNRPFDTLCTTNQQKRVILTTGTCRGITTIVTRCLTFLTHALETVHFLRTLCKALPAVHNLTVSAQQAGCGIGTGQAL